MSDDDRAWFEENQLTIASLSRRMEGVVARAASERERRYAALEVLLEWGPWVQRPVVSRVVEQYHFGVAYDHPPNDATRMREIFLIREGPYWKVRRFLGKRDEYRIMEAVAEKKYDAKEPLNEDERRFLDDPAGYAAWKRRQLLSQSGAPLPE